MSTRGDAGGGFTAKAAAHMCHWLFLPLDHGPAKHPLSQGAMERIEGWLHEVLAELCKGWPGRWNNYVGQHAGPNEKRRTRGSPREKRVLRSSSAAT